jgi:hypothetical protein
MQTPEIVFLAIVVGAFAVFAASLAHASFTSRHHHH